MVKKQLAQGDARRAVAAAAAARRGDSRETNPGGGARGGEAATLWRRAAERARLQRVAFGRPNKSAGGPGGGGPRGSGEDSRSEAETQEGGSAAGAALTEQSVAAAEPAVSRSPSESPSERPSERPTSAPALTAAAVVPPAESPPSRSTASAQANLSASPKDGGGGGDGAGGWIAHFGQVRWATLRVSAIEDARRAARNKSIRWQAATFLQKVYRGWEKFASWKRLRLRLRTHHVQSEHLEQRRAAAQRQRDKEAACVARVQSRIKGWFWRVRLKLMKLAAVQCQRVGRGYNARRRREAMERERLEGLPVVQMYQRGVEVSGTPLIVTVKRCGYSYKFEGTDLRKGATYSGFCYGPQTMRILDLTQPKPPTEDEVAEDPTLASNDKTGWTTAVRPWQHERVTSLLLSMLAVTEPIAAPTNTLKAKDKHRTLVVSRESKCPAVYPRLKSAICRVSGVYRRARAGAGGTSVVTWHTCSCSRLTDASKQIDIPGPSSRRSDERCTDAPPRYW